MESVFDCDGADVGLHRRNHRLQPLRNVVVGVVVDLTFFLRDGHDVHLLRHAVNRAYEMRCRNVEPERADTDVPLRLPRTDAKLAQLDALATGKLEAHRVA